MKQSGLLAPLAFGEPDAKSRIKNVLNYKKPAFWISVVAVIVLVVAGFCLLSNPAENNGYMNRYPEDARASFMNKVHDDIQIKDGSGNDISYIAIDLWYAANEIYNVDDVVMFEMGEREVSLAEYPGPQSNELVNYYDVVGNVFTGNGIAQLEQTMIGGNAPLIRKINGKVYRMGAWKTGYSYGYAMESMQTKEIAGERITITALYEIHAGFAGAHEDPDYVPEYYTVDFTIAKVGGKWLVDDYRYPEARTGDAAQELPPTETDTGAVNAAGTHQADEPEYDFFAVPEMTAGQQAYYDGYLRQLISNGLLLRDWSGQNHPIRDYDTDSYLILAFEDITGYEEMQRLFDEYNGNFPASIIEGVLLERFPFTVEQLHEIMSYNYRANTNTYYYEGGRGGGPIEAAVVGIRTQGDFVHLDYEFYNGYSGLDEIPDTYLYKTPGVLTLQRKADGSYLYYAVDVGGQEEAPQKTQAN